MGWVFAVCSVVGGTVLICQFLMSLAGLGHLLGDVDGGHDAGHDISHDVDHDTDHATDDQHHGHESSWLFGVLTFRTVVAAITFFGLAGLAAEAAQLESESTLLVALLAGAAALYAVHWLMHSLSRLKADGTARVERSIGRPGKVYLRIPAAMQGMGKVTVHLGDRTVEYQAVTAGEALPTGASVLVKAVISSDVVEVKAVQPALETTNV
jgi:hypothetical protein